jgi:hypothetical protein
MGRMKSSTFALLTFAMNSSNVFSIPSPLRSGGPLKVSTAKTTGPFPSFAPLANQIVDFPL